MTPAQKRQLEEMQKHKAGYYPIDYNFGSKKRACENLIKQGLARNYLHGGYEITEAGKAALSSPKDD